MTTSTVKQKGLLLATAGEAVSFELPTNRDETWNVTVYTQAGAAANISGYSGTFSIRDNVAGTELVTGSITLVDAANGIFSFSVGRDDFDDEHALFDLGEELKSYRIAFKLVDGSSNEVELADGTGATQFPFRLRWAA